MAIVLLTIAEYARHRGCDEKAVRKALAEGRINRIGTERRCLNPVLADDEWAKNTRARGDSARKPATAGAPGQSGKPETPEAGDPGYSDHRARREKAEADRAEILAMREQQLVLLREPTERAVFDTFRGLRDAAFQAMRDASTKVRELNEAREIQLVLEDELRTAFTKFEETTRKRLDDLAQAARP
jgi:hypothetical protein